LVIGRISTIGRENAAMRPELTKQVVLSNVKREFARVMTVASHINVMEPENTHPQPHPYITTHTVCMRAAGWCDTGFDTVMTVSGAGLLFAYDPKSMMPKYAHLFLEPDSRIAEATGFGWEWLAFEDEDEAWMAIRETIDSGRPAKAHFWEEMLFAGYRDTTHRENRRVFVMGDPFPGPGVWWSWLEFVAWCHKCSEWKLAEIGRHTRRVRRVARRTVAAQIIRETVAWSKNPPLPIRRKLPEALFGLEGIRQYADDVEARPKRYFGEGAWLGCHAINPQWTARSSTAVYLDDLARRAVFRKRVSEQISEAADKYRLAYLSWLEFYRLLGHIAPKSAWNSKKRRREGAAAVRRALEHEKAAIGDLKKALLLNKTR
jgi:hypothetical protein